MAFHQLVATVLFVLTVSRIGLATCLVVKGKLTCLHCSPGYNFYGIKVAVKCDDVKNMTIATAERDGSFIVKLPMDAKLKCLAKLLGGPKQLYAQRKDMVADVVEDGLNDESYTISNPLAFSTRCPVALTDAKCGTISSSKTIDLPIPPEWGLAPTSYYFPVFPIIGVP